MALVVRYILYSGAPVNVFCAVIRFYTILMEDFLSFFGIAMKCQGDELMDVGGSLNPMQGYADGEVPVFSFMWCYNLALNGTSTFGAVSADPCFGAQPAVVADFVSIFKTGDVQPDFFCVHS